MTLADKRISRRGFLRGTAVATAGMMALPAVQGLDLLAANGRTHAAPGFGGYGPLYPTPDERDGVEHLALPRGFRYRSFSVSGDTMSDGDIVPIALDGMASFNMPEGRFRLVRNHEDRNDPGNGTLGGNPSTKYDSMAGAGCSTLVVNPFTRELERDFISQNGSIVNCAGGLTPRGSWLTCEETNEGPDDGWDKQHGYCFEVPASADDEVPAVALRDMGRFAHEAVAVDPKTGYVYETEDNGLNSGLYRFIPNTPGVLANGGKLQMLAVEGDSNYVTYFGQNVGVPLPVTWVEIDDPDPPFEGSTDVFDQGFALGGAPFSRLEGCWWGNGSLYFNSTSGGNAGQGQVWRYKPDSNGGTLTLVFESPGASVLNSPDNIAVSPQGGLLLCEDGDGDQYLRGITPAGSIFDFALNLETTHEWAGATFAIADIRWNARSLRGNNPPLGGLSDRTTLFVNRQGPTSGPTPPSPGNEGMTFAIWGPWRDGAL